MKDSIINKLESLSERHEELQALLGDASIISDQDKFRAYSKEYSQLEEVVGTFNRWKKLNNDIEEAQLLLDDPDMKDMAAEEIAENKAEIENLEQHLQILLLPKDPNDEYNAFLEIRAGTGGDEAGIFAGDLYVCTAVIAKVNAGELKKCRQMRVNKADIKRSSLKFQAKAFTVSLNLNRADTVYNVYRKPNHKGVFTPLLAR